MTLDDLSSHGEPKSEAHVACGEERLLRPDRRLLVETFSSVTHFHPQLRLIRLSLLKPDGYVWIVRVRLERIEHDFGEGVLKRLCVADDTPRCDVFVERKLRDLLRGYDAPRALRSAGRNSVIPGRG